MKKLILIILISIGTSITFSQCGCTKVVILVDNSVSVGRTEYRHIKSTLDSLTERILKKHSSTRISIIQFASNDTIISHKYHVSIPFTSDPFVLAGLKRHFGQGTLLPNIATDHLPGSLYEMRKDSIWYAGKSVDLETDSCSIRFFLLTDAIIGQPLQGCCSVLSNVDGNAPLALPKYGEYNWLKSNFNSNWSVFHAVLSQLNLKASAAISSKGGFYNSTIDSNSTDPEGFGGPRKLTWTNNSFDLKYKPLILDTIINNINVDTSHNYRKHIHQSICNNDSLLFRGNYYDSTGTYTDTSYTLLGCDSIFVLYLTKGYTNYSSYSDSICSFDSLYFNRVYLKASGIYKDTLRNINCCDSIVTLHLSIKPCTLGLRENKTSIEATIFPNPTNGNFTITTNTKSKSTYYILDVFGKLIQKGEFVQKEKITFSNFSKGIYFVRITNSKGNQIVKRIVLN